MDENQNLVEEEKNPASPFADGPYQARFVPAPEKPVKKKKNRKCAKKLIVAIAAVALVAVAVFATAFCVGQLWEDRIENLKKEFDETIASLRQELEQVKHSQPAALPDGESTDGMLQPSQVYAQNVGAVVAISNQGISTNIFGQVSQTASSGSGFIISADGYVVSNYHVVKGANKLTVFLAPGKEYDAQLVGYDASNDLSVLKIEAQDLPYVKLGSSDSLVVGDRVAAIGNPLGELTSSMTVGYISAKDRSVNTDGTSMNMLQTDASINSGNSGGPLFNMYGEVIGITTAKYSGTSNSGAVIEGIGFAIPIDDVAGMIRDIVDKGYVSGAYLGVVVEDVSSEDVRRYGLPQGALVTEVSAGFAAERAGVLARDIIVELGGKQVDSISTLTRVLRDFKPGDEVDVKVYRGGKEVDLMIVLDEKPKQTESVPQQTQPEESTPQAPADGFDNFFWPFFG